MLSADKVVGFFQSDPSDICTEDSLLNRVESLVEVGYNPTPHRVRNLKLRFALFFSPINGVKEVEIESDLPRYIIITDHINDNFGYNKEESKKVAKAVQTVLDAYEEDRKGLTGYRDTLLKRQSHRCMSCNFHFTKDSPVYDNHDEYKPLYAKEELTNPEVDHIEPVWAMGKNNLENSQVLCKFCNRGKGELMETKIQKEIENARKEPSEINWRYRAEMFYYCVSNEKQCAQCGNSNLELTVRPIRPDGAYIKSNLKPICIDCAF